MFTNELNSLIPADFADNARVWIYQSSRAFIDKEEREVNEQLQQFYTQWQSHGALVIGWSRLQNKQNNKNIADETEVMVGGCSTDSSVRVIKSLERQYDVNFFDRMMLTFLVKNKAEMLPFNQVQYALDKGYINKDTLLFNNLVANKKELLEKWLVPLEQSWLADRVSIPESIK